MRRSLAAKGAVVAIAVAAAVSGTLVQASASPFGARSQVTAAQKIVTAAEKLPTKISVTASLKTRPRKGKTVVYITGPLPVNTIYGQGIQAAAKELGWNYKSIFLSATDTSGLIPDLQLALTYHPVAVTFLGSAEALWSSEIHAYAKAGVAMIPEAVGPVTLNKTVPLSISEANQAVSAQWLASWAIADSKGKAHILLSTVPSFPILNQFDVKFKADVKTGCSSCKVIELDSTIPQAVGGDIPNQVVASLLANPSVGYVISSESAFVGGVASAVSGADLKVKIGSAGITLQSQQDIVTGSEAVGTTLGYLYDGWQFIDAAARHAEGMSVPQAAAPSQLIVKANFKGTPRNSYDLPSNYQAQFEKLWKI
jgi:ribose transport system substrate-binding protein